MATDKSAGTWITKIAGKPRVLCYHSCQLEVISGKDVGKSQVIAARSFRVGAKATSDMILADSRVSGTHFEIALDSVGYRLRDLGSSNGTFVSGYRINDMYIGSGTAISVGDSEIRFTVLDDTIESPLSKSENFGSMIGGSPLMRELFLRLERIAATDVTLLLTGETGTGKDLAAEAIHQASERANGPFAVLDCGAIPRNLIESELFGHERGAFTGATESHTGVFERGIGGTVFLDEIGELPLELQPKLLRVLEKRRIRRVGGKDDLPVDIRIIAATNRDLALEISAGRFREDLFYRLAVVAVSIPPLRERKEDITALVTHILGTFPKSAQSHLDANTIALLKRYDWPGNVRELRNVLERAALLDELPANTQALRAGKPVRPEAKGGDEVDIAVPLKVAKRLLIDNFEQEYVAKLLKEHQGNISAAARAAGVDRMVIHKIAERFGLRD